VLYNTHTHGVVGGAGEDGDGGGVGARGRVGWAQRVHSARFGIPVMSSDRALARAQL
jgi:hypothetical protein